MRKRDGDSAVVIDKCKGGMLNIDDRSLASSQASCYLRSTCLLFGLTSVKVMNAIT